MTNRLLLTGGGTGGHIFPLLVVGRELKERGWKVRFVGSRYGLESAIVPRWGFPLTRLPVRGVVGTTGLTRLFRLTLLPFATVMALFTLLVSRPDVVFSTGGYASFPSLAGCRLLSVPMALLEQNASPGKVIEVFAKRAARVFLGFKAADDLLEGRLMVTGNPVSRSFHDIPDMEAPEGDINLLVLGGSQGSRFLNDLMIDHLSELSKLPVRITHQCGEQELTRVSRAYADSTVEHRALSFIDNVPEELKKAHLVISRAGAMSVAEITASGRPALFIPFARAYHDHQTANAKTVADNGGGWLLSEEQAGKGGAVSLLSDLIRNREAIVRHGLRARELSHQDALTSILGELTAIADRTHESQGGRDAVS